MTDRMQAQHDVAHWEKKLGEENAKLSVLQETAEQLEQEFQVGFLSATPT